MLLKGEGAGSGKYEVQGSPNEPNYKSGSLAIRYCLHINYDQPTGKG